MPDVIMELVMFNLLMGRLPEEPTETVAYWLALADLFLFTTN